MENDEIRDSLRAAERAEAAPWIDYPPTPLWYPPAAGVWAAALTLAFAMESGSLRSLAVLGLVVLELGFLRWYRRYRGAMPSGVPPRELRPAIAVLLAALAVLIVAIVVVSLAWSVWAAAAVALVGVTVVVAWYERAYATATVRARQRLA